MVRIVLILVVIIQSSYFYGMELAPRLDPASYMCGITEINLLQGSPYQVDGKVDFIVFGTNEQQFLKETFADHWLAGDANFVYYKSLYIKPCKNVVKKRIKSVAIGVTEPLLFTSEYSGQYYYYVEKNYAENKRHFFGVKYFGDEAIQQASNDLVSCYNNVLALGLRRNIYDTIRRSIALPAIGTEANFPKEKAALVAVSTIVNFIKNNPRDYSYIKLFVKTSSEFMLYQELLDIYLKNIMQDSIDINFRK